MRTSFSLKDKLKPIKELRRDSIFRLMQYEELLGTTDKEVNDAIVSIKTKLKQIRIALKDSVIKVREENILYCKGDIEDVEYIPKKISFGKQLFSEFDDFDDIYPSYTGTGEIILSLSFSDFIFIELEDEAIIVKEESFWVCDGEIYVDYEGEDELLLKGSGVIILEIPVSEAEVMRCAINNDSLKVFGDDVILRRGSIEKRELRKYTLFEGSGEVWLTPTKRVYENIKYNIEKIE